MKNFKKILRLSQEDLMPFLTEELLARGYEVFNPSNEYLYAEGSIPVLLVAHLDTVHMELPVEIHYDAEEDAMWSPQGLGADDRAGVYSILRVLEGGQRPHVLFTTDEETGCQGARKFSPVLRPEVRYMIGLDRKGSEDAVFYDCHNQSFIDYVKGFGYKYARGTSSDIKELCPDWNIAGVNLSVGYYNAHTREEYLNVGEMNNTIARVAEMLSCVPEKGFTF